MQDNVEKPFSFGRNWQRYLDHCLSDERLEISRHQTAGFLGLDDLTGLTFLDIGCGSGLFSHAAYRLGAEHIVSFDVDPHSVECCRYMRQHAGSPENWEIRQGSILDADFVAALPKSDIVYSWGVLHHTGHMWDAIRNAAGLVNPGGRFFISIYNRLEFDTLRIWRGSHGWLRLKRLYNRSGWLGKRTLECYFASKDIACWLISLRNPVRMMREYQRKRGMSWWYDIVDWLGGYPYEFASAGEVFQFCRDELGFALERMTTTSAIGCHQFVFIHDPSRQHAAAGAGYEGAAGRHNR